MTARVRWHEDFRKTAGERRPGLVREVREREATNTGSDKLGSIRKW